MKLNLSFVTRKKRFNVPNSLENSELKRVLNVYHLTALGISSMLGSGVYIITGHVMSKYAGPAVIISFVIAAFCTLLSALCYAELGSRIPRSGSVYTYIYVTFGELSAFIVGWDVILEYAIGASSLARSLSLYIDSLANDSIHSAFAKAMPMVGGVFATYPDFLALAFVGIATVLLIFGVREGALASIVITVINVAIVVFIFIVSCIQADTKNWSLNVDSNLSYVDLRGDEFTCTSSQNCGNGGFMPFGFYGVVVGAAKCFYAFIGLDVIATTGEEVRDPKKAIPISILVSVTIVSCCFICFSFVASLLVPYYVYNAESPITDALDFVGLRWAYVMATIGAIFTQATCLYSLLYAVPRVMYSMAADGLIPKRLAVIYARFQTPGLATLSVGLLAGLLALVFRLEQLVDMLSLGVLLTHCLAAASTLVLRHTPAEPLLDSIESIVLEDREDIEAAVEAEVNATVKHKMTVFGRRVVKAVFGYSREPLVKRLFWPGSKTATRAVSHLVNTVTSAMLFVLFLLAIVLNQPVFNAASYFFIVVFGLVVAVLTYIVFIQPQTDHIKTFKAPFVPFLPVFVMFASLVLIVALNPQTWGRFAIWLVIGLVVYFGYGIRKSYLRIENPKQNRIFPFLEHSA